MTAAQHATLKTELDTDPQNYGYAEQRVLGADQTMADMLNHVRDGVTAPPAGNIGPAISGVKRADISPEEVFHAIALADLVTNPGASQLEWFGALFHNRRLRMINEDGTDTPVRANVLALLKSGASATKTRLQAIETRFGSRAEQLFGTDVIVTNQDIAASGYTRG
jgi:hypothetical protein